MIFLKKNEALVLVPFGLLGYSRLKWRRHSVSKKLITENGANTTLFSLLGLLTLLVFSCPSPKGQRQSFLQN